MSHHRSIAASRSIFCVDSGNFNAWALVYPLNVDLGLVNVDEWAFEDGLKESQLGCGIVTSHGFQKVGVGRRAQLNPEKMVRHLTNDAVGEAKDDPLVHSPCLEAVIEG